MLRSWSIRPVAFSLFFFALVPALPAQETPSQKDVNELFNRLQKLTDSLDGTFKRIAKDIGDNKRDIESLRLEQGDLRLNVSGLETRIEKLEAAIKQPQDPPHVAKKPDLPEIPNQPNSISPGPGNGVKNGAGAAAGKIDDALAPIVLRIEKLESQISAMQREVEKLRKNVTTNLYYPPKELGLDDIKNRLGQLEKGMAQLNPGRQNIVRSSPTTGRIRLVNSCRGLVMFLINGRPERVDEGAIRVIESVTPGPIQYEVISDSRGSSGRTTTILNPGETLTLTAH